MPDRVCSFLMLFILAEHRDEFPNICPADCSLRGDGFWPDGSYLRSEKANFESERADLGSDLGLSSLKEGNVLLYECMRLLRSLSKVKTCVSIVGFSTEPRRDPEPSENAIIEQT